MVEDEFHKDHKTWVPLFRALAKSSFVNACICRKSRKKSYAVRAKAFASIYFHGVEFMFAMKNTWPMTLMCVLFLLLMPVQGYYWLGKRAQTKLNKKQALFYVELCKKLTKEPVLEPTMMDLALRIKEGIAVLGPDFLKNL